MVVDGNRFRGLITLHEIKTIPKDEWSRTTLQAAMIPQESLLSVSPETAVADVLDFMREHNISQVPVVDDGRLVGVIGRDRLLSMVHTRLELKV